MVQLKREFHTSILLITHDLGVVAEMADDVAVMYLGQIVEYGPLRRVFKSHRHPYTRGLLNSVPVLGQRVAAADGPTRRRLVPISGVVPDARRMPSGCRFAPRCPYRFDKCSVEPPIVQVEPGYQVRCWLPEATGTAARKEGPAW
jgi:oligopeptide/dipeptide ABC transporter ATP-binding protein